MFYFIWLKPYFCMFILYSQPIWQKIKNFSAISSRITIFLMLLALNNGCVQKVQEEVQLEIKSLQPLSSNGIYNVSGNTNLAEDTKITIAAVRYLQPTVEQQDEFLKSEATLKRSILARQIVEVKQGQWQADLNLWQVARDGSYQEVWQANQQQMRLTPENDVMFIATFDPSTQPDSLNGQKSQPKLEGKLLRFTNEGEKYVQASQSLSIPLPAGKTTPSRPQPEDLNDGWGNRYQIPPEPFTSRAILAPPAKSSQTNIPLPPSAFIR